MNVPKLRFKADDGSEFPEWEEKRLGDICEPLMYGMGAAAIPYDGQNKYIRITDIDDESHKYKSNDIVSPAGMLEEKYLVCKGDILLARTGASTGKSYLYDEKDGKMYFAGFLIKAHVNEECDAKFIYAQTLTTKYMNWVKLTSMRSGQPGINANEYSSYAVSIACIPEQQKIADFLSTIDEIIQSTESELTAWEERKRGVMQKIFNREVRFKADDGSEFPEWEEKRLGEVATRIIVGLATTVTPYYRESGVPMFRNLNIKQGWLDDSDMLYLDSEYADKQNTKCIYSNDVLTVHTGNIGWSCVVPPKYNGALSFTTLITTFDNSIINSDFICNFLNSSVGMKRMNLAFSGGRANLNVAEFEKVLCPLPSLLEQKKIAECLSSIDSVIRNIQAELSAWKEFKKGLLQQMFV